MTRLALLLLAVAGISVVLIVILTGTETDEFDGPDRPAPDSPRQTDSAIPPDLADDGDVKRAIDFSSSGGTGSLLVLATDASGAPVGGVDVIAVPGGDSAMPLSRQTGDTGGAVFAELPAGVETHLTVGGNSYHRRESRSVMIVGGRQAKASFVIERGGRIRGRVVTEGGHAPDVEVRLSALADTESIRFATHYNRMPDATLHDAGSELFEIGGLAPGTYVVIASAKDYTVSISREVEVLPGETTSGVEVVLLRGASVSGVVVDPGGNPVAGATVVQGEPRARFGLEDDDFSWGGSGALRTSTDAQGRFRIGGIAPGKVGLVAVMGGFAPGRIANLAVEKDRETAGIVITISPGGTLTGTVRDKDGQPIPGAEVLVGRVWPGMKFHGEIGLRIKTNEDGVYRISNVEPGRYKVTRPARESHTRIQFVMDTGEDHPVEDDDEHTVSVSEGRITVKDIVEAALSAIEGVVLSDTGRPLHKQVNLRKIGPGAEKKDPHLELPNLALTDEKGAFSFTGLEPGTFELSVGSHEEKLTVLEGETRRLEIRIPVHVLEGTAIDGDGQPVGGADVYPQRRKMSPGYIDMAASRGGIKTDDAGRFTIRDLDPGVYTVAVHTESEMGLSEEVTVGPDRTPKGLRIVIQRLVRLRITVLDSDGQPVKDRWVILNWGTEDGRMERTSGFGTVEFRLVPRTYRVQISGDPVKVTPEEITLGSEPQEETVIVR